MLDKQAEKVLKIAIAKYNGKAEDYTKITEESKFSSLEAYNPLLSPVQ